MSLKTVSSFWTLAALVVGLLAAPGAALAQNQKIAVISTQAIIEGSEAGKAAIEQLRQLQEQKSQEVQTKQQEIEDLRNRLAEGRLSLAEERIQEMQTELETKVRELRRLQEDAAAELNKRQEQVLSDVERRVMPIINQMGEEEGYTLIFRKFDSGLIYVDDAVDITAQVIERLDAEAAAGSGGGE